MSILVLNAGSSTLKFALFDESSCEVANANALLSGIARVAGANKASTLSIRDATENETTQQRKCTGYAQISDWVLESLHQQGLADSVRGVGHRVVHGGDEFTQPTRIDDAVVQSLQRMSSLAPLHNPRAVSVIQNARDRFPNAVHVGVFDTGYFADLATRATTYPIPHQWTQELGIRRYGFHGVSHEYCASRVTALMHRRNDPSLKLVICHLGSGCSVTAVKGWRPVGTTMGFTPMDGLMMGSRCGSIDPGIITYVQSRLNLSPAVLEATLNEESGLLGVSGVSADYRIVEEAAEGGNEQAQLAIDLFVDRVRSAIGSMAVNLGGIDALVFTGGIGEHSANLRTHACYGLGCLGIDICESKNREATADGGIASTTSEANVFVIRTKEEAWIAEETKARLPPDCAPNVDQRCPAEEYHPDDG